VLRIDLGVDEQYLIQEALDTLYEIIDSLPEEYRKIFELSYVKGLKNEEIARELNLSLSGTKKRKARFLELLREKLSKHTGNTLLWMISFQICQRMAE
jgi:RNA polymerase sigma-70 factor (ECF subfamily)